MENPGLGSRRLLIQEPDAGIILPQWSPGEGKEESGCPDTDGKGFHTIEAYHNLETVFLESGNREDRVILLECMSNLVANEQFGTGGSDEEILGRIFGGVRHLQDQGKDLIIITNEVFSDGSLYERETLRYLKLLGQANRKLALWADQVTEVIYGIGVGIKGKEEDYGKQ